MQELTGGGAHYTFEAIGLKATAEQAFQMLRRGGTATVIGMIPPGQMVEVHGPDLLQEKKLQGSFMGSNRFRVDMPRFVDFYLQGKLHLDDMISRRIKLARRQRRVQGARDRRSGPQRHHVQLSGAEVRWISFEKAGRASYGVVVGDGIVDVGARRPNDRTLKDLLATGELASAGAEAAKQKARPRARAT